MRCPLAWAYVCRHTRTDLDTPFSLGTAGGCILEKSGGFLKVGVKEAVCAHGKVM